MSRHERRDVRYRIRLPVTMFRGPNKFDLTTEDVSFSGLFIRTDSPPQLRQLARIQLNLPPQNDPFLGYGMAVHIVDATTGAKQGRAAGCGMQFYGVTGEEKERWDGFIRYVGEHHGDSANETIELNVSGERQEPIRRRFVRHNVALKIRLKTVDDLFTLYTRDVSHGGMFISTDLELNVGGDMDIDMVHPDSGEVFKLKCVVRHRINRPGEMVGVGVEFVGLDEARSNELFDFINLDIPIDFEDDSPIIEPGDPKLL